ncbi:Histidine kinase [Syntrophobacter sp. SbD2]|nr:Histidine kinase [Syntrophobacter sp. SbD2]
MMEKHYYTSLTRNMTLIVIVVSFTPLILIAGLIGYYFETSYREKVMEHLHELVEKHQQIINSFLDEKLSYIKVLSDSYTYDELTDETFLQNKLVILQNAYSGVFVDLGVVNSAGVQISYAGSLKLLNADYSKAQWFREAIKRDYYMTDVFLGLRRMPHFIISVKKRHGDTEWLLRATIDFVAFNSLVEQIHIGKTGSAFIVNSAGELQTRPGTELTANLASLLSRTSWAGMAGKAGAEPVAPLSEEVITSSSGSNAVSGIVKSRDRNIIFILMPLKAGEWTLAYQQDQDDAFSEVNRARVIALAIFIFGCLGIVLVARFISQKMVGHIEKADLEKEMMNEQVIEAGKLASIGELAAGIAHEINNPVAIMVEEAGWMEDLLEEEDLQQSQNVDEFRRSLKQVSLQGLRCKEITHKLLSFARKTDPAQHEIQVNDTIEEILSICKERSKFNNIRVQTELDEYLPLISASPTELQQVFMNLINNAIDAIGSGGGLLEIRSRVEGDNVVVDIADTGHGISKSVMARIFDPFFTTKPVGKGTGLGLSICYGIIKKLGGNLTVDSSVGLGTTFHVNIPIHAQTS